MSRPPFLSSSTPPGSSSALASPKKTKATKKRKTAKQSAEDKENTQPKASKSKGKASNPIPEDKIRSFLANFDLEAENRFRKLRKELDFMVTKAKHAAETRIESVPSAVREATVEEFVREGKGSVDTFLAKRPARNLEQSQEEWERAKKRKVWDSTDVSSGASTSKGVGGVQVPVVPSSSSGVAADSEGSIKPVKKPPISRKATTKSTKKGSGSGSAAGPSRATRRTSVVLRTQQGDEFDVDMASTSQLEELGLSANEVSSLRAILQKLKA
ncbi:hypothetical protein CF319_g6118 [Tilletia indica]|uniref:Borealin N-terminal domain-containing protein n=1 Tax=Tilletia indica TaxID=43049 RepID=A0A177THL8_9BASI|nr:hypothetical protein CF319_g6118 [Tilletia indica]KAE8254281.1 hypothetical protein A4X13_0g3482 [Tilletia indica]